MHRNGELVKRFEDDAVDLKETVVTKKGWNSAMTEPSEEQKRLGRQWLGFGLVIGVAVGAAVGVATDALATGLATGTGLGLIAGAVMNAWQERRSR